MKTKKPRFKSQAGAERRVRVLERIVDEQNTLLRRFDCWAMFMTLMIAGRARWEFFSGSATDGEVVVGGLRYATKHDSVGRPVLHIVIESAMRVELSRIRYAKNVGEIGKASVPT